MAFYANKKYVATGLRVSASSGNEFPYEIHFFFMEDGNEVGGRIDWQAMTTNEGREIDAQTAAISGSWAEDGNVTFTSDWTNSSGTVFSIKYEGSVNPEDKSMSGTYSCEESEDVRGDFAFVLNDE